MLPPLFLLLFLMLSTTSGCTPMRPGGAASAPAAGVQGAFSTQAIVADEAHNVMVAQVMVLEKDGAMALTAEIGQTWHSGQVRLRMDSAWHGGQELPFRRAPRTEPFCIAMTRCQGYRTGTLVFTPESFGEAAREGYPATLIGPDDTVRIFIPASLFVEARDRARASGIWRG